MTDSNIIHLIMGISSVGKSSFIKSRFRDGMWDGLPIIMAYELENESTFELINKECVIHYNLLRPYSNSFKNIDNSFIADPVLLRLMQYRERIRASILIAHHSEMAKRILLRAYAEPILRETFDIYPQQQIFEILCHLDLDDFHRKWFQFLDDNYIKFDVVSSSEGSFSKISSLKEVSKIFSEKKKANYTNQDIDYILRTNRFEYQRIEIFKKNYTLGQDRSESLRFLDKDYTGKSVLDIGCAYGYFCFEAEKRNAARVIGTELKRYRFIGCNILKEIFRSNCEFLFQDVFNDLLDDANCFDTVLLFNVIHHLKEPIKALRIAAQLCNEKLIIEFPTLLDNKFQSTLNDSQRIDPCLPLIGVSLSSEDQTFLFSKEAINRILLDHERLFSKIIFEQSPMSLERCIAICYK